MPRSIASDSAAKIGPDDTTPDATKSRLRAQEIAPTISLTIAGLCFGAKPTFTGTPDTLTLSTSRLV